MDKNKLTGNAPHKASPFTFKYLLSFISYIMLLIQSTNSALKWGESSLQHKYDKPSSEGEFRRFDMINNTRTIGIIGTKQYHSVEVFSKASGGAVDYRLENPPSEVQLNQTKGGITCWNAAEISAGTSTKPYCVYCAHGGCVAYSGPGKTNKKEATFQNHGGTSSDLPYQDQYWDVVSFDKKEFFFAVSSMVSGHFGVARFTLAFKSDKTNCYLESKTPSKISVSDHSTPTAYDLNTITFDYIVILSIYQQKAAKLYMIDASTMGQLTHRPFPTLVNKGTGRLTTHFDKFYLYRATTCVITSGKLYCETINYTTGASISKKEVADTSTNLYDPALCAGPENRFYIVASKKKFYFFDADNSTTTAVKEMAMVVTFDVVDMNTFYGTNEIFVLTKTQFFAGYFQDVTEEEKPLSPLMHSHCTAPAEDKDSNPTQAQIAEGLVFSRFCTTCQNKTVDKYSSYKASAMKVPSEDSNDGGDKKFCVQPAKGGTKPTGATRTPTFDFTSHKWNEDTFVEKCGQKTTTNNSTTSSTSNSTNNGTTDTNSASYNSPDLKEDKLLGMTKPIVYIAAGVLTGMTLSLLFSVVYCASKNSGKAVAETTLRDISLNHMHPQREVQGPYPNQQYSMNESRVKFNPQREHDQDLYDTRGYDDNPIERERRFQNDDDFGELRHNDEDFDVSYEGNNGDEIYYDEPIRNNDGYY